jgi:hypothetical protein
MNLNLFCAIGLTLWLAGWIISFLWAAYQARVRISANVAFKGYPAFGTVGACLKESRERGTRPC